MSRGGRRGRATDSGARRDTHAPAERPPAEARARDLAPGHPAMLAMAALAAACVLFSITFRIEDPDLWQHLTVGKAIWSLHRIPHEHLWTWPSYGMPEVLNSWGFRALLWPFWAAAGDAGLLAWRWLMTLATFALLWAAARRMGARGMSALAVLVVAGFVWRGRSEVRPETLVAPLLALQLWVLETRRSDARRDPSWLLVPIAWAWANVHISYYLGLVLIAFYALDEAWRARRATGERPARVPIAWIGLAAAAVSFLNPFGWRALWQPFEYFLVWRHEPIFRTVIELMPLDLWAHWRSGLPLLVFGWPLLTLVRLRARGIDWAELLSCATFTWLAFSSQRFAGLYALVAAPFVARDLAGWLAARRGASPAPSVRFAAAALVCLGLGMLEWNRPGFPIGLAPDLKRYPVRAADYMRDHGVKGRGFNPYYLGGYLLWRFWPEKERLPFMDIHQTGSREDRRLLVQAYQRGAPWHTLDAKHRFDWVLLEAYPAALIGDRLLETVDADTTFALVFRDDQAALFVRRQGPLAALAARDAYRFVPASDARLPGLLPAWLADSTVRHGVDRELDRMVRSSPDHARVLSMLGTLDWVEKRPQAAKEHLRAALQVDPSLVGAHQRLGIMALLEAHPEDAVREFEAELRITPGSPELPQLLARAYRAKGDPGNARKWLERELKARPLNAAARESLRVVEAEGLGR